MSARFGTRADFCACDVRTGEPNSTLPAEWTTELRRHYFAAVSATDELLGSILDELASLGIENNTVVTFLGGKACVTYLCQPTRSRGFLVPLTTDHGWHLSENGLYGKCTNFNTGTHIPMMLGGSRLGVPLVPLGGIHSSSLAEAVDLLPTILELAGVGTLNVCDETPAPNRNAIPLCREGVSLLPLITNATQELRTAAFSQYPVPGCGGVGCDGSGPSFQHPTHMGYTMITSNGKRITEWLSMQYDNKTGEFLPQWGDMTLNEPYWLSAFKPQPVLPECPATSVFEYYDHSVDPEENNNLAREPSASTAAEIKILVQQLRAGWRAALAPPASPA